MSLGSELLMAVVLHFPHTPARECLLQRQEVIEVAIEEARVAFPQMPSQLFVAVGFWETHLGCDANENGNWGAPISATQRHVAGTPFQAARILWRSYQVCGDWLGAARRFRTGNCTPSEIGSRYANGVLRLSQQLETLAQRTREYSNLVCVEEQLYCY